jgi:proto-chlorophyllide reductase subunit
MKFLCVLCDQPMKLLEVAPPDRGSLNVLYECPECAHRIAMLTNPFETQLVSSLGVQIGANGEETVSKCPFSGMLAGMGTAPDAPRDVVWTEKALARLERIPEFVRPMARTGIEKFARERGVSEVDEPLLDQAKDFFGM